jgi:hypothetical protein
VFAAALILGLILFTDENAARDVRKSLVSAIEIMKKISGRSRQAEHYLFILRDMQKDIERFQEQVATSRRQSSHRPVKRLMQQPAQGSSPAIPMAQASYDLRSSWGFPADLTPENSAVTTFPLSAAMPPEAPDSFQSWNFPSIQFWDDFSAFGPG